MGIVQLHTKIFHTSQEVTQHLPLILRGPSHSLHLSLAGQAGTGASSIGYVWAPASMLILQRHSTTMYHQVHVN